MRRLGVHTSIAGGIGKGVERARDLGCSTMQFFSHNPRAWAVKKRAPEDTRVFRELRRKYDIRPAFIHTSYLINLASPDRGLLERSVALVVEELDIADELGAEYIVLHTGSASGHSPGDARKRAIDCLCLIAGKGKWKAGILLENTAGERGDVTCRIQEIAEIADNVTPGLIAGVCIDTCHAFAAGYDLRAAAGIELLASELDRHIGRDRLRLIHLNDAKGEVGSGLDRHEHIGEGKLGAGGITALLNHPFFAGIPVILETPKKSDEDDPRNLACVRKLLKRSIKSAG